MFYFNSLILIITLVSTAVNGKPPRKIKGGDVSSSTDFRFMVAVKAGTRFCGGVLITKGHVLTAAQCVTFSTTNRTMIQKSSIQVIRYRNHIMNDDESEVHGVSHMNVHGTWIQQRNYSILEADIAILQLKGEVLSIEKRDIPKWTRTTVATDLRGLVLGWGSGEAGGKLNSRLQEVTAKVVDHEYCKREKYPELAEHTFCTQSEYNDATICDGDIGGPFLNDHGYIAGIISHTTDCTGNSVNVFTDILSYKPWIQQILKLESAIDPNTFSVPDVHERLYVKS